MTLHEADLEEALKVLGELLEARGETFEILVIGGGALLLLGFIERPTKDLDVVARFEQNQWLGAEPFPVALVEAVKDTADALDLAKDWLNPGPAALMDFGLPAGFPERAKTRTFGSLKVRFASREDHVAFKLYAAADHWPDRSKHWMDLEALEPTHAELRDAATWCRTHDPSEGFRVRQLLPLLSALGTDINDV